MDEGPFSSQAFQRLQLFVVHVYIVMYLVDTELTLFGLHSHVSSEFGDQGARRTIATTCNHDTDHPFSLRCHGRTTEVTYDGDGCCSKCALAFIFLVDVE
jgi:hypothetical protein